MPSLATSDDLLRACVHCGFCLSVCPTYRVLGEENDSPRGRLFLMRAVAEGQLEVGDAFQLHIDRCLGCLACEPACPAGVQYGTLLEAARADLAGRGRGPGRVGRMLLGLLASDRWRPLVLAAARLLRATRLPTLAGKLLRGPAGLPARLLSATAPAPFPAPGPRAGLASAGAPFPRPDLGDREPRHASGFRRETGEGDHGSRFDTRPSYALLEGCVMRGLFGHVHAASRRTLAAGGYREIEAPGQSCCGALHAHAGDMTTARRLARRNIAAFETAEADWVAVDSAGCGQALREYPRWLEAEPEWAPRALRLSSRSRDVTELLVEAPRPIRGQLSGRVGYDAPCHLTHGQGVRESPLRLLATIDQLDAMPLPSAERCCGGAGLYNLNRPRLSADVLSPKLAEIRAAKLDWVATGNPGCIMQIGAGLTGDRLAPKVVHPVELLDRALSPSRSRRTWS